MVFRTLPLGNILAKSILLPLFHFKLLLTLCAPYIAFSFVAPFFIGDLAAQTYSANMMLYIAISVVLLLLAAVNCHKVFLLSDQQLDTLSPFSLNKSHVKFAYAALVFAIMSGLLSVPFIMISSAALGDGHASAMNEPLEQGNYLFYIMMLPVAYFSSRWAMILPDAAVGEKRGSGWAWSLTQHHALSVFVLIGIVPVGLALLAKLILSFIVSPTLTHLVGSALGLVFSVIELCILSLTYAWLVEADKDKADTQQTPDTDLQ
ncbi:hypothetical protein [Thalassotalea sp. Y01]|uniref:hypothetical protein n=1 Tax=Thalassotalea sp. Y01 TaxID=2729613 RepID=UPI00145D8C92|nr:hypothetical protein [Thalassotalea sp. Y01]NMP15381.1 hypothetical protein [Thalassotalea sp. Y01]